MKTLITYINEALNPGDSYSGMFQKINKNLKTLSDLKDGKYKCPLLLMSFDTQELIKEFTIDVEISSYLNDKAASYVIGDLLKDLPQWFKETSTGRNEKDVVTCEAIWNPTSVMINTLAISNKFKEGLYIVWNKENKDKFIKFFKNVDQKSYNKFLHNEYDDERNSKELNDFWKKHNKRIRKNLSKLVDKVVSNGESYSLDDLSEEIKDKWGIKISENDLNNNIFGDITAFNCCTLGNSGELENTFWNTLGNDSYVDVLPYDYTIGKSKDNYEVTAYFGMDKNDIFICMIEDEAGNYNILCM